MANSKECASYLLHDSNTWNRDENIIQTYSLHYLIVFTYPFLIFSLSPDSIVTI
jgi:hypothetical protein